MGWKNWSYWLKGGIIGLVIFLIITVLFQLLTSSISVVPTRSNLFVYFLMPGIISALMWCGDCQAKGGEPIMISMMVVISIITYFLIGAIIGYIYGKIKNKY